MSRPQRIDIGEPHEVVELPADLLVVAAATEARMTEVLAEDGAVVEAGADGKTKKRTKMVGVSLIVVPADIRRFGLVAAGSKKVKVRDEFGLTLEARYWAEGDCRRCLGRGAFYDATLKMPEIVQLALEHAKREMDETDRKNRAAFDEARRRYYDLRMNNACRCANLRYVNAVGRVMEIQANAAAAREDHRIIEG